MTVRTPDWAHISITQTHVGKHIIWDTPKELLLSAPVVTIAENEGGGFEFTLSNDYTDPTKNVLAEEFNLWREVDHYDGDAYTGALKIGMFVQLANNGWQDRVTEGRITEITSGDRTVTIRCADFNSILGQQGQSIFRSYIGGRVSDELARGSWNASAEQLEIAVPDEAVVQRAEWGVPALEELTRKSTSRLYRKTGSQSAELDSEISDLLWAYDFVGKMSFRVEHTKTGVLPEMTAILSIKIWDGSQSQEYLHSYILSGNSGGADFTIDTSLIPRKSDGFGRVTVSVYRPPIWTGGPATAVELKLVTYNVSSRINKTGYNPYSVVKSALGINYVEASGSQSNNKYVLSSIAGYTISADMYDISFKDRHARISYSTGRVQVSSIQELLAQAGGYDMQNNASIDYNPSVREFRVGGGYLLDYMKVLSDISEDGNRCRAFRVHANRQATPVIHFGNRDRQPQQPSFSVAYGDYAGQEGTVRLQMMSHVPAQTMINRPSQIMARTKVQIGDDVLPMMVTVTDWDAETSRNLGTIQYAQGDETSEFADTVSQAWGALRNNNVWEGSATVSGIYTNLIGYSGAGTTVAITDPRAGMDGYLAVVKSVVLDYNRQTTTITYGNLGEQYGNKIKDAGNMALFGAGRAVDVGSLDTLYSTQYVRVVSDVPVKVANVPKHVVKTVNVSNMTMDPVPAMTEGGSFALTIRWRSLWGIKGHFVGWDSHPDWITANDEKQTITADNIPVGRYSAKYILYYSGTNHIKILPIKVNPVSHVTLSMRLPDAERNGIVNIDDDRVKAIVYPNGDRALISLVVKADPDGYYTTEPNAITQVVCNDTTHLIPEALRPDLYKGQALVVNLDVPVDKS